MFSILDNRCFKKDFYCKFTHIHMTQILNEMNKKLLRVLVISLFVSSTLSPLHAQVTIGSDEHPIAGAILDLKEHDGLSTASKGMMLPRVGLTSKTDLYPMFKEGYDKAQEDAIHAGLLVYNVNEDLCENLHKGVFAWDGTQWVAINKGKFPSKTSTLVDTRDPAKTENYRIGEFGAAGWWMLENLRAEKWPNNDPTAESVTLTKTEPILQKLPDGSPNPQFYQGMYYYPNFDEASFNANPHHGYLYNYAAVSRTAKNAHDTSNQPIGQGICPDGWHVPSYDEWVALNAAIAANVCQYTIATDNSEYAYLMQSNTETPNGLSRPASEGGFDSTLLGGIARNQASGELSSVYSGQWSMYWLSNEVLYRYGVLVVDNPVGIGAYSSPAWWVAVRCKANDTTVITPEE